MADISKINPNGGPTVYDLKDAYVRSLVPSNADPDTNKLATMADVGGGSGITWIADGLINSDYSNNNKTLNFSSAIPTTAKVIHIYGSFRQSSGAGSALEPLHMTNLLKVPNPSGVSGTNNIMLSAKSTNTNYTFTITNNNISTGVNNICFNLAVGYE